MVFCRLCLKNSSESDSLDIFSLEQKTNGVISIITKYFWFEPQKEDATTRICFDCLAAIKSFNKFYMQIENAQKTFIKLNVKKELTELDMVAAQIHEELKKEMDIEINVANDEVIVNAEENIDKIEDKTEFSDDMSPPNKELPASGENETKVENTTTRNKITTKLRIRTRSQKGTNKIAKLCKKLMPIKKENNEIEKKISSFMQLKCDICQKSLESFKILKKHFKIKHKLIGYVMCCSKKFYQTHFLIGHIDQHLNPETYKCHECDRVFSTKYHFERHNHNHKMSYNCKDCKRKFPSLLQLERHEPIHYEKDLWTYKCDYCERSYPSEFHKKAHIIDIHEKKNICSTCGETFSSRRYKEHLRKHSESSEKVKLSCEICGARLLKKSLRAHMKCHADLKNKHVCSVCGKNSPNGEALKVHMRNHNEERKHQCFCGKSYKRPLSLKQHQATHTGEFLYQCPHCPKAFVYDSAFSNHRKRDHPLEFEKEKSKLKLRRTDFTRFIDSPNLS